MRIGGATLSSGSGELFPVNGETIIMAITHRSLESAARQITTPQEMRMSGMAAPIRASWRRLAGRRTMSVLPKRFEISNHRPSAGAQ